MSRQYLQGDDLGLHIVIRGRAVETPLRHQSSLQRKRLVKLRLVPSLSPPVDQQTPNPSLFL
eukprot:scaffold8790_cov187-Amphora_coffeaeformis.AAC.2